MKTLRIALFALPVAAAVFSSQAADQKPITLELPKPIKIGTPVPIKGVRNLDPNVADPAPLMIPADATVISAGKTVTSSDAYPVIGELPLITDGDKEGSDGSFVELGPDVQWVQIDLGAPQEVNAIALWHFHSQDRVYHDVIVQISNDADFVEGVTTVYNNDDDNSSGLGVGKEFSYKETFKGRVIDGKGAVGRYVRCSSKGSTANEMNHYIEVEVWGRAKK